MLCLVIRTLIETVVVLCDDVDVFVSLAASTAVWSRNGQGSSSPSYEPPLHSLVRDTDTETQLCSYKMRLKHIMQCDADWAMNKCTLLRRCFWGSLRNSESKASGNKRSSKDPDDQIWDALMFLENDSLSKAELLQSSKSSSGNISTSVGVTHYK